jgi:hypothetical protein
MALAGGGSCAPLETPMRFRLPTVVVGTLLAMLAGCKGADQVDIAVVGSPVATPAAALPGETTTVSLTISNQGDLDAGAFDWAVRRDGVANWLTGHVAGLPVGQQATISFAATDVALGFHTYQVILNSSGSFRESDLENNTATITIGEAIDLQFQSVPTITPDAPTTSDDLNFSTVITSATTSAISVSGVAWTLSRDGVAGYQTGTLPLLAPGDSTPLSIPLPAETAGSHTFGLTIDPDAVYNDSDRTTNTSSATVVVAPAGGG